MIFSFWLSLIREIVKDVEDRVGDESSAYQTFVIRFGLKKTKILLNILSGIFVVFLVLAIQYLLNEQLFILSSSFLLILVVFALFHLRLNKAENKADFHKLSLWIKGIMLLGVLTLLLI
jgi:4-hydroxybenzoate polyprenyltransferase